MADVKSRPVLVVSVPSEERSRSASPRPRSPAAELRGIRLFRAITRRLSRRRPRADYDSTDSEPSSSSDGHSDSGSGHSSPDGLGESTGGLRRVISSLTSLTAAADAGRRPSDSNSDASDSSRRKSAASTPKKILRQPVSYTYVRGLSGLPTIRVPRQDAPRQSLHAGCGR